VQCIFLFLLLACSAAKPAHAETEAEAYTRVINERAKKIVDTLAIDDQALFDQVQSLIAEYYRGLSTLHDALDAKLTELNSLPAGELREAKIELEKMRTDREVLMQHRTFVAALASRLSPEQVDQVKDGLTYGVVQGTYARYLQLLPELTEPQQRDLWAMLIEAREYAMDGGSSDEKHGWFRKYKGRINNYLSKAGIDMKAAEQRAAR
jgi:hypothetical protein